MKKGKEEIYNIIMKYCKNMGYIKTLKNSLKVTEGERFNKKKIKTEGLDIMDAVYCVYDKPRTKFFLDCIDKIVKKDNVVIEAGTGTGILSFMSAYKGAQVYSLELNKNILNLAKKIAKIFYVKKIINKKSITFLHTNAIKYKFPEKADVVINENIYTGMFYEKQVQIANNLVSYLKKGGIAIPSKIIMGVILINAKYPYIPKNKELFNVVEYKDRLSMKLLSESIIYATLDFTKKNNLGINKKINFKIIKSGEINGILIWNKVILPNGKTINRFDTTFLNSDILFYLSKMKRVLKGDIIKLHMKYRYGSKPKQAIFNLT